MKKITRQLLLNGALALAIAATLLTGCKTSSPAAKLTAAEATQLGTDAYIYGYPLVTMEYSRRVLTNVREPMGLRAPAGQFGRAREYPNASFHDVTAPNADTLYTTTWLDVSKEPWILSLPDANDRYYLFPMLDGWTTVFQVPGKRTTGTGAQKYAITGPGWKGTLPAGVTEYKSATSMVWILGRIYCTGTPEDYDAVHQLQDEITVVPLSAYGGTYMAPEGTVDPSIDMKTPVRDQVNALSASDYFSLLAKLMKDNPPTAEDAPMVAELAKLCIVPGKKFDINKFSPEAVAALQDVPKAAVGKIMGWFKEGIAAGDCTAINGWLFTTKTGIYGTNYIQRALIAAIGLGANRPQDAVYPTSEIGADGKPYSGANKYIVHFDKGQLPPVDGFWSLTMYDGNYFFVENPLNRYSISARQDLKKNDDGSVDLYLQHDSPGADKESNWLPAPPDKFILMMRLYWPKEKAPSIIDGSWTIPPVKQVM
jgi:hypothetical protein